MSEGGTASRAQMASARLRVIGRVGTPFAAAPGTPVQPRHGLGVQGTVTLDEPYAAALQDIEGFERLWLLCWLDRADPYQPLVVPYRDTVQRGLFATRAPCRPNPIGLSVVRLVRREGAILHVMDLDLLDGTPLLDVKPYVPDFDAHPGSRAGWFDGSGAERTVADGRFHRGQGAAPWPAEGRGRGE